MSSRTSSNGRLALAHRASTMHSSSSRHRDYPQHQHGHASSRRHSKTSRPRNLSYNHNGSRSPLKDVTTAVLAAEYYLPPVPDPPTFVHPQERVGYRQSNVEYISRSYHPLNQNNPKSVRWADLEEDTGPLRQPRTPQQGRLKTPELEPVKEGSHFCKCCACGNAIFQEGRSKMNLKCRYIPLWYLAALLKNEVNVMTKQY